MLLLLAGVALPSTVAACEDAGPRTHCLYDAGTAPEWLPCDSHANCPSGSVCEASGFCACGSCPAGDACDGGACRCAWPRPAVPSGCWLQVGDGSALCEGDRYVVCPDEARACADGCVDRCEDGRAVPCVDGTCTCLGGGSAADAGVRPMDGGTPSSDEGGGCAVSPGPAPSAPALLFALVGLGLLVRRRLVRRRR